MWYADDPDDLELIDLTNTSLSEYRRRGGAVLNAGVRLGPAWTSFLNSTMARTYTGRHSSLLEWNRLNEIIRYVLTQRRRARVQAEAMARVRAKRKQGK